MGSAQKITLPPLVSGEEQVMIEEQVGGPKVMARGATVPTDATAGYAPGCIFIQTDGGAATTLYINEGTLASCDFNAR